MSIVPLKKVTVVGSLANKDDLLSRLQKMGCVHMEPLKTMEIDADKVDEKKEEIVESIKYLETSAVIRNRTAKREQFDLHAVLNASVSNFEEVEELKKKQKPLQKRIENLSHWGDFRLPKEGELLGYMLWFYIVPKKKMKKVEDSGLVWQVVGEEEDKCYVVVISKQEPEAKVMPVPRTHTGNVILSDLKSDLNDIEARLEELNTEKIELTRWLPSLKNELLRIDDSVDFRKVFGTTVDVKSMFVAKGWIPHTLEEKFRNFAANEHIAYIISEPSRDDAPPTLLDNPEMIAGGEQLIGFYQTPAYNEWDPSNIVFFSFAVFFAMIVADAGYGMILGLIVWKFRKAMSGSQMGIRIKRLGYILSLFSVAYGAIIGSYFGAKPPLEFLKSLNIVDSTDSNFMMMMSVVTGMLHIIIGNLCVAWSRRHSLTSLAPVGWALIMICAGMLGLAKTQADQFGELESLGKHGMITGAALILLFSSERPFNSIGNIIGRLIDGFLGLTQISGALGDTLSYLRLFALGLAGGTMAVVFNDMAGQIMEGMPTIGIVVASLVLLVGHTLNFILALMGGVVHGLRLNVIEFFNWSLSDEGCPFKPFKLRS